MPKAVQIREVPDEVVATMQTRAAAAGMSMSEYLRGELVKMAGKPTVADVLARARARHGGVPTGEIVRIIREMRDDPEDR